MVASLISQMVDKAKRAVTCRHEIFFYGTAIDTIAKTQTLQS